MKTNLFRNIVETRHATSLLVLLLVLLLAFAGCKKDDPAPTPEPEPTPTPTLTLTVSPEVIDTTAVAGTYTIAVTSNTTWTVNSSATWSTPDNASGTNNGTVTVSVNENPSTEAQRSATVTFAAGTLNRTVAITQAAALPGTPPQAASTRTWTFGDQTWSDAIQVQECNKADFIESESVPDCRSYADPESGKTFYYYNWPYVRANAAHMCQANWRVPARTDFEELAASVDGATFGAAWGGVYGGIAYSSSVEYTGSGAYYWSSTVGSSNTNRAYYLNYYSGTLFVSGTFKYYGFQVRCVK
jgi:uncharacterized protein (TIGR02145 family)